MEHNSDTNKNYWLKVFSYYRKLGWSVIPIGGDKKPLVKWTEFQSRLPSDDEITDWCGLKGLKGIAVVTGKISNIMVLDVDQGSKLDVSQLPSTPHSKTGSGGSHYFFIPPNNEIGNSVGFLEKTDIRANGGYAILPPSIHPNGNKYEWITKPKQEPFAPLPILIFEQIEEKVPQKPDEITENIFEGVDASKRNNSASSVAGKLLNAFKQKEWQEVAWPLLKGWNLQNRPPLDEKELRTVYESIAKLAMGEDKQNQTEQIIHMLQTNGELFNNQFREPHIASLYHPFLAHKIISPKTETMVRKMYWDEYEESLSKESITGALQTLHGLTQYDEEKPQVEIFNRVARYGDEIYYDIGDDKNVVKITPSGWEVVQKSPVYFSRYSHQRVQVLPQHGGNLRKILDFINVSNESQIILALTYLVVSLIPDIPRVVIILHGDQGSAKSTFLKQLRSLIDPSSVPLLTPPESPKELVQSASQLCLLPR